MKVPPLRAIYLVLDICIDHLWTKNYKLTWIRKKKNNNEEFLLVITLQTPELWLSFINAVKRQQRGVMLNGPRTGDAEKAHAHCHHPPEFRIFR